MKENMLYEEFLSSKIFPNQKYQLCIARDVKIDDINDENIKYVLESSLKIDLKSQLLLNDFSDSIILEHLKITDISDIIIYSSMFPNILQIEKTIRYKFYSVIFPYSEKNETLDLIIAILNFFFKVDSLTTSESSGKLSNELRNKVIDIAIIEVADFISGFSTMNDLTTAIENDKLEGVEFIKCLFNNLSILYNFTTKGKIFPNQLKQFADLDDINWLHDQQLDDSKMIILLDYLVKFSKSDEIKNKVLNISIKVNEPLQKVIKVLDLKYLSKEVIKVVNQNDKKLYLEFLKFIRSNYELKMAFSSFLSDQIDNQFDQVLSNLIDLEDEKECIYRAEALVYETLQKSGKYRVINWPSKSDIPTDFSITLENDNVYYIKEKNNESYDIYAEELQGNKFYFEIKYAKDNDEENKISFNLTKNHYQFANDLNDKNSHFVLVLVKNVLYCPTFLFLTKQNELFIE